MKTRQLALMACATAVLASAAHAQHVRSSVSFSGGTATDLTGARSNALSIAPSLAQYGVSSTFSLSSNLTRFSTGAKSGSLAAAYSARGSAAAVSPTIDLGASGAITSYSFSYFTGDVTPAVEARFGNVRVFGGVHLGLGSTTAAVSPTPSPLGGPFTGSSTRTSSQSATSLVAGASMTSIANGGESTTLSYRGEDGVVAGLRQRDHQLSVAIGSEHMVIGGAIGQRSVPGTSTTYGSGSLTIGMTPRAAVQLSAGRYPANALLGTAAGQFANAGLSLRIGKTSASPSLPRAAGLPPAAKGVTRLSILAPDATTVELGGDFNKWKLVSTRRATNGVWYVDLRIPPGEYRYAFRIDGKEWRVPAGVAAADDEFGGKSAWLTVTPAGR